MLLNPNYNLFPKLMMVINGLNYSIWNIWWKMIYNSLNFREFRYLNYSSQLVLMVMAWISRPISSFNKEWTMRCRSKVDFPLNPSKWMVVFRCIPELLWPICWEEVFSRLTWPPAKWSFSFCSISSNVLIIISLIQ